MKYKMLFAEKRLVFQGGGEAPKQQEAPPPVEKKSEQPESKFYLDGKAQAEVVTRAKQKVEQGNLRPAAKDNLNSLIAAWEKTQKPGRSDQSASTDAAEALSQQLTRIEQREKRAMAQKPSDAKIASGLDTAAAAADQKVAEYAKLGPAPKIDTPAVNTAPIDAAVLAHGGEVMVPGEGAATTAAELAQKEAASKEKGKTRVAQTGPESKPTPKA
jgi:hypothetical protein